MLARRRVTGETNPHYNFRGGHIICNLVYMFYEETKWLSSYIANDSNYLHMSLSHSSYMPYDSGITVAHYLPD